MVLAAGSTAQSQVWPPWANDFDQRGYDDDFSPWWEQPKPRTPKKRLRRSSRSPGGDIRSGGGRPAIAPVAPPVVAFPYDYPAQSIVIVTGERMLFYVLPGNRAYEYRISVGREGFNWSGTEVVSRKQSWPDWHPPKEMRERDPTLPVKMTGGIRNPLGALALYLGDTLYRIHGTNDVKSIGRAASSGCFRMRNSAVLHLASLAEVGTPVTVVGSLRQRQSVQNEAVEPPLESETATRSQAP